MAKKDDTVRFTAKQIKAKLKRGESRTDWKKIETMTEAALEASIKADPDDVEGEPDWTQAVMGIPPRKEHINIRIDADVLAWFRLRGKGYQSMMNNVLRAFVQTREVLSDKRARAKK